MVALNFNPYGNDFERGLMILRDSLTAAIQALDNQAATISKEYAAYEEAVRNGTPRTGQWNDEAKTWEWEQSQFYQYDLELIEETKSAIRKAHATAIYHLWERVIRHWTKAHGRESHQELAERAKEKGQAIHDRLQTVSHLNNALKHSSQTVGPKLLEAWPEILPDNYAKTLERQKMQAAELQKRGLGDGEIWPDWFDAITLTDANMDAIFEAVRASGPRAHSPT